MKIIAAVGDSHTWGEGVGAEYFYNPGICGGEKRMLEFFYPFYVNLLRCFVNAMTDSSATEYCRESLLTLCEGSSGDFGYISGKRELEIREKFGFCRIFFRSDVTPTEAEIFIDGKRAESVKLDGEEQRYDICVHPVNVFAPDDTVHELTVRSADGKRIALHRIECYSGPYAVVNCGIGSCPVPPYIESYYDHYVRELHPSVILFEGCTINDWLSGISVPDYGKALAKMLGIMRDDTHHILMHTVFPIGGERHWLGSEVSYDDYVEEMRRVAKKENVPLVDCNKMQAELLKTVPQEDRERFLYHDNWHPNSTGHALYAEQIFPALRELILKAEASV